MSCDKAVVTVQPPSRKGVTMAKQKTVWVSEDGFSYDTEEQATLADLRYNANTQFRCVHGGSDGFNLKHMESLNVKALQPIYDYFGALLIKARDRQLKHG